MDDNIDEQIQKLEQLQKLYTSEDFEQHNAFGIAIIEELKKMLVSKNESLHDVRDPVKEAYQQGFNDGASAASDSIAANPERL